MKKKRIAIPMPLQKDLLYKSAKTCCVCKKEKKVIIHHIDDDPSNNKEKNLIVLCPDCHDDAHLSGGLTKILTPSHLRGYKKKWIQQVLERSNKTIDINISKQKKEEEKEKSTKEERYITEVREEFKKLDNLYKHTLNASKKIKIDEDMIHLFIKYKNLISRVYNPEQLKSYIHKIEKTSYQTKQKLKLEILENYFINTLNSEDNLEYNREYFLNIKELLDIYPDYDEFVNKYRNNYTYKPQTLLYFFDILVNKQNGCLSRKQEIIICNFKNNIKKEILSTSDFFANVVGLIEKSTFSSNINCLKEIIKELEDENIEYKQTIQNIRETSSLFEYKMG